MAPKTCLHLVKIYIEPLFCFQHYSMQMMVDNIHLFPLNLSSLVFLSQMSMPGLVCFMKQFKLYCLFKQPKRSKNINYYSCEITKMILIVTFTSYKCPIIYCHIIVSQLSTCFGSYRLNALLYIALMDIWISLHVDMAFSAMMQWGLRNYHFLNSSFYLFVCSVNCFLLVGIQTFV